MDNAPLDLDPAAVRVRDCADLIETIPFLLGFHPHESVVLVGLAEGRVSVTARLDLSDLPDPATTTGDSAPADATAADIASADIASADIAPADGEPGRASPLAMAVTALGNGEVDTVIVVIYLDAPVDVGPDRPFAGTVTELSRRCLAVGIILLDAILVIGDRWWSYRCEDEACCPPAGRLLPGDTSEAAACAVYAGMVALPDRSAVTDLLAPAPASERARLDPLLADQDDERVEAILAGGLTRYQRSVKRALFGAARAADDAQRPDWPAPSPSELARFGVALADQSVFDPLLLALDAGRLDGRALWQYLACQLPGPYDAAPLTLFGWASWRSGSSTIAMIAAQRATDSDPTCLPAEFLRHLLLSGANPHRTPRLRTGRRPVRPTRPQLRPESERQGVGPDRLGQ
jgi:hypothetical protein